MPAIFDAIVVEARTERLYLTGNPLYSLSLSPTSIPDNDTCYVPADQVMIVADEITNLGELIIHGELLVLDTVI